MPLRDDLDLRVSDLQALSGRDQVAALFAQLGYDTNARLVQTAEAMGLTAESLRHEVRRVERLADHEDGALQVYLLELRSVTVAHIQAVARALRNRAGKFLWVITSDYERLDFVLFELTLPEAASTGAISLKGAFLRPRVLTVHRNNPDPVHVRVLRRFSYTEIDSDYQWQKLQSAYGIAEWSEPFFNNRALFADYYLEARLPVMPVWEQRPDAVLRQFKGLFDRVRGRIGGQPEAVARAQLLEPALTALGFTLKAGKGSASEAVEPDYYLMTAVGDSQPVAYCSAYAWGRALDGPDEARDPGTPEENPGAVVVSLLERDDAPDWAIVTNGKVWRLYSRRAHSRATNYYEIDLEEAVASAEPGTAFRYFWLFFRAAAFVPAEEWGGARFLDWLAAQSALYAKELGERLKDHVFEEIFPHFAAGFIADLRESGAALGERELDEVYHATLTFLYRLLFLLYAEARDLLPAREERGYHALSLTRLKLEIAGKAGSVEGLAAKNLEGAYSATATGLYDRLARLFAVIDRGDSALNVPLYNGGLFITRPGAGDTTPEAAHARFLAAHKIPDRYLALGLDRMARDIDDKTQGLVMIDYKSLGVRQLGSIYEGLLEFKVRIAAEKLAVVKGKRTEEYVPAREAEDRRVRKTLAKGAVYLENDRRERKATGSYYTPDYIVKYIVQHTVGPVLDEKLEALRPRVRQAQKRFQEAVKRKQTVEHVAPDKPALLRAVAGDVLHDLFDVKVLDPAMGSGHFLVEAVDFTTDRMVRFCDSFPFLTHFFDGIRREILEALERQGVTVDPGRLTDVNLLKRHVLKRCIYGVDLNPMAVELAKVSLWLDCFTLGAPLSFLDHHVKCGNSLIGARIAEVRQAVEFRGNEVVGQQMGLFSSSQFTGVMLATDLMRHVGELSDVTAEQVEASRAEFRRANDALAPFKRILDVYVSRWFGNEPTKQQAKSGQDPTIEFLRSPGARGWLDDPRKGTRQLDAVMKRVGETALRAAEEKRFFHWELEFPEVFFGAAEGTAQAVELVDDGGFDAVVGNPPYSSKQSIESRQLMPLFRLVSYRCDPFAFFVERAFSLVRTHGYAGYIIPATWTGNAHYETLRRHLLESNSLKSILLFRGLVFEDANVDTSVVVLFKDGVTNRRFHLGISEAGHTGQLIQIERPYQVIEFSKRADIAPYVVAGWDDLVLKIDAVSVRLSEIASHISLGLRLASVKDYTSSEQGPAFSTPLFLGDSIDRYEPLVPRLFFNPREAEIVGGTKDPKVYQARPKILLQSIRNLALTRRLVPTIDTAGNYFGGNIVGVIIEDEQIAIHYVQALMASALLNAYFANRFVTISMTSTFLGQLPVRRVAFTTPAARRKQLAARAQQSYAQSDGAEVLTFVGERLDAVPEEADVVHDLLAFLAEQMIELNKQKQAEQKRFLGWLEGALKITPDRQGNEGLDALTGKTTLRGYLGDYQKGEEARVLEEIAEVLHKNRNRLGVSLSDARFQAKLKAEYEGSLATLLPIKAQLARTDALIDQVVYRLYGLTEEEIAVVEGRAG